VQSALKPAQPGFTCAHAKPAAKHSAAMIQRISMPTDTFAPQNIRLSFQPNRAKNGHGATLTAST